MTPAKSGVIKPAAAAMALDLHALSCGSCNV